MAIRNMEVDIDDERNTRCSVKQVIMEFFCRGRRNLGTALKGQLKDQTVRVLLSVRV